MSKYHISFTKMKWWSWSNGERNRAQTYTNTWNYKL